MKSRKTKLKKRTQMSEKILKLKRFTNILIDFDETIYYYTTKPVPNFHVSATRKEGTEAVRTHTDVAVE